MIEIKITAETALEALKDLNELTTKIANASQPVPSVKADKAKGIPAPAPAPNSTSTAPVDDTPPREERSNAPASVATVTEPPSPTYTLETIRAAGVTAAESYGKDKVKAILTGLGVSGMTQLTPEQYPSFMERLGGLHA